MKYRTRQERFPDTDYFHYHNANNHNRKSDDCAIRAICTALGESWETTLQGLYEIGIKTGYVPNDYHCIERYLISKGWVKRPEPRHYNDNTRMICKEWLNTRASCITAIANLGSHHMAAIVNGVVYDIWDSSKETIHNYWVKGE